MARPREGIKVLFIEAPVELAERLRAVAKRNHRSTNGEALAAIERHVEAEETARVHLLAAPPKPPPEKPAGKPRRRKTPGKGKGGKG